MDSVESSSLGFADGQFFDGCYAKACGFHHGKDGCRLAFADCIGFDNTEGALQKDSPLKRINDEIFMQTLLSSSEADYRESAAFGRKAVRSAYASTSLLFRITGIAIRLHLAAGLLTLCR